MRNTHTAAHRRARRTRTDLLLPILASCLVMAGCASLPWLESPDLTLVDLQLTEATLFETTLQARLRLANPNREPLTFEGASFKLGLEGRKVGRGLTSESYTIPRLSTGVIDVTFHISNASLLLRLQQILEQQVVSYSMRGKLYVRGALGTRKLKIGSEGRLDFANRALNMGAR